MRDPSDQPTAAFLGKRIIQKYQRNLSSLQRMPAVCPATPQEAFTTNESFAARLADLGGQ